MAATIIPFPRHRVTPANTSVALSAHVHTLATRDASLTDREQEHAKKLARIAEILAGARGKDGALLGVERATHQLARMMDRARDLLAQRSGTDSSDHHQ